jgi:excisionase family DNA binding protein
MEINIKSFDDLPLSLSVIQVAHVLGISRSNAYMLIHTKGFPRINIGKRIVIPRDKFILWIEIKCKENQETA